MMSTRLIFDSISPAAKQEGGADEKERSQRALGDVLPDAKGRFLLEDVVSDDHILQGFELLV